MITVAEALDHLFALVTPTGSEMVPLREAAGRVLAAPVTASRAQPPFNASAMDGYAVTGPEPNRGSTYKIVGTSAAGAGFFGELRPGEAVRIFTGAPVPPGGTFIIIQEDAAVDGQTLRFAPDYDWIGKYIRPEGCDFDAGFRLDAPRRLRPTDVALLASMNAPEVPVARKPIVAIIATGNELVQPGERPGDDQIFTSNTFALAAMVEAAGGAARVLPIARDDLKSLEQAFTLAAGADLIVTIGGASVGDHDLVADAADAHGMERSFYRILMRPGKPLMAGRMGAAMMLGLPGNPVSSIVCAHVFMLPVLAAMQGLPPAPAPREAARLGKALAQNGPREHYMRARRTPDGIVPFDRQDSSLLTLMADADVLMVRAPDAPPAQVGDPVDILPL
ncbi:MAG: molybdopterin molybdotransferase MoeA [Pseudomonadota bacterium]